MNSDDDWGEATKLVRGGLNRSKFGETAEAIYMNSGYVYPDAEIAEARFNGENEGYIYSRYGNPTVSMFEERLRLLEGAESCYATASGMAAVYAAFACQLQAGDHIVAAKSLFSSCFEITANILPRFGIDVSFVDGCDIEEWEKAIKLKTRCVFFETPSNPTFEIVDIAAVSELAHNVGALVIIDNVFASPILQKPIVLGADIVVYSGTKHIDGQGRCLGGAILSSAEFREEKLQPFLRHTGPSLSPFNAWILLKGLETLSLRVREQSKSASIIAEFLESNAVVSEVYYPHLSSHPQFELATKQMSAGGTIITFKVNGNSRTVFNVLNKLKLIDISNNIGDTKSLITHPATTTHRSVGEEVRLAMGITDNMIRLSVGLETTDDIIFDLKTALSTIK